MDQQIKYYRNKLNYETDATDLAEFFKNGHDTEKWIVIDTRTKEFYEKEHIPGAVNFPHRTINETSVQSLDRDALYITYCDGIGCNASTKGALKLAELGFKVKELLGGIDWWKRDGYSTEGTEGIKGSFDVHCAC